MSVTLRPLAARDSLESLTALLHRAYARLGAMGLNFTAVDQSAQTTRDRVDAGQCFVLEARGELAGTVLVAGPYDEKTSPGVRASPWYLRRDMAHLHQLAVDPPMQGRGLGAKLIAAGEEWVRDNGRRVIALDTAAPAAHLRHRYERLGYRDVDQVQWPGKRYRSVLMVKALVGPAPHVSDIEHHCALVRVMWAHVQARDWAAMRAAYADDAVMNWPCSHERMLDGDAIVRVNAIYPEGWNVHVVEVSALADGRVHSLVEVRHDTEHYLANSFYRFEGTKITHVDEYWASVMTAPAWRTAEAIGAYQRMDPSP